MSDRFEDDLMEDLMAEPMDEFDEAEEADAAEDSDEFDEFEESDEFDDSADEMDSFEGEESADEFEEGVTDALEAEDADEFFGGFKNILKTVGNVARKAAPFASLVPIPGVGAAANLIGSVLADEGDEMDALEDLADYADEEEGFDALAPAVAGLAIRAALKQKAARIPRVHRRKLVKTVSAVAKRIARKHGARAMVAVPGIVRSARHVLLRKRLPVKHLPHLVARAARLAVRSPRALRKFARVGAHLRTGRMAHRAGGLRTRGRTRYGVGALGAASRSRATGALSRAGSLGGSAGGAVCPTCQRRTYRLRGPVSVTIRSS
jgi:hypothetical protein